MFAKYVPRLSIWLLAVAVIGLTPVACATDEASKQEETKAAESSGEKEAEEEVKVYTNADLEKMFADESDSEKVPPTKLPPATEPGETAKPAEPAEPPKTAAPPAASKPADALALMQQQQAQREEEQRTIAEVEKGVADARARVKELEERIMALRNPFRARPVIPEDEKADWDSMGTRQRLEDSEEKLRLAREELAKAEKELAEIR
jgi:hypothetical protein